MPTNPSAVLDALGDPSRRLIVERLSAGPLPVGVLAGLLPLSRPAVNQHLKVLKTAADVEAAFHALPELDVLHVTGITAALSDSCHEAVQRAVELARARRVLVSFDVNLRRTLPGSRHVGSRARAMLADVDVLFVGDDELAAVSDTADPDTAAAELLRAGPAEVVLKRGTGGATTWLADGGRHSEPAMRVAVADTVGAGDSFVAGYLAARCDGCPVPERLARGTLAAACTVGTHGDWEGLPTAAQVAGRSAQPVTLR